MILATVGGQFGGHDVSIVTNMDFGHTDPQWILPLGVTAELDGNRNRTGRRGDVTEVQPDQQAGSAAVMPEPVSTAVAVTETV